MPTSTGIIPFSEIIERVQDLSRSNPDIKGRVRGLVNDVYTKEIPRVFDWSFLKASSAISCVAKHNSGFASVTTQGSAVTLQSSNTISAAYTGRKVKFTGNPDIYDITFSNSTAFTISPILSSNANVSTAGYTIFQSIYSLPSNFDRFPVNGGLLFYSGGRPKPLPELIDDDYYENATASPTSVPDNCRFVGYDTAGNLQVEIIPPPSTPYVLLNEYIKSLTPMSETTLGTIVVTSNQTIITGTNTYFIQANTGDYLRADGFGKGMDSTWYRVASVIGATSIQLATNFRIDSSYSGNYTLCSIPKMPPKFHDAILYGTIEKVVADQQDPTFALAHNKYATIMTDNKVLEQSRHAKDTVELIAEDYNYRW